MAINLADLAYAQHQAEEEKEKQSRVVVARNLYAGDLDSNLVSELTAVLPGSMDDVQGLFNLYGTVIDEIIDRLTVVDMVNTPEPRPGEADDGQPVEWAMAVWQAQRLDELQHLLYEDTAVDGEAFLLLAPEIDHATQEVIVKVYLHNRYTSADVDGDNQGMKLHYKEDERSGVTPIMASKRWIETYYKDDGSSAQRERMTLYIAADGEQSARIEKYEIVSGVPTQFQDEADTGWPIWWTATGAQGGESLPIPVIHFRNRANRQAGSRAGGAQALLDNFVTILASAAATNATPTMTVIGGYPTDDGQPPKSDGSNVWTLGWRKILGFPTKRPDEAKIDYIAPGNVEQLLKVIDKVTALAAITTGTPSLMANRIGGQPLAAESLRMLDVRPTAVVRQRQHAAGNSWSAFFRTYAQIHNAFATGEKLDAETPVYVRWLAADVRGTQPGDGEEPMVIASGAEVANGNDTAIGQ